MSDNRRISIIICTCDRRDDLEATLQSIGKAIVSGDLSVEVIVVDNGSTGIARAVMEMQPQSELKLRYVLEPRRGKSFALNTGVHKAEGSVLIFTDDDVRVPGDWIERMSRPILNGECDVIAGGIVVASDAVEAWMSPLHQEWLGTNVRVRDGAPYVAFPAGANFAVSRRAIAATSGFDIELGPGPMGLGNAEDSFFIRQLEQNGFRMLAAPHAQVIHCCQRGRVTRGGFLVAAQKLGRSHAYVAYHWEHGGFCRAVWGLMREVLSGVYGWMRGRNGLRSAEGIWEWKLDILWRLAFIRQYLHELGRTRKYAKHGLVKRGSGPCAKSA